MLEAWHDEFDRAIWDGDWEHAVSRADQAARSCPGAIWEIDNSPGSIIPYTSLYGPSLGESLTRPMWRQA